MGERYIFVSCTCHGSFDSGNDSEEPCSRPKPISVQPVNYGVARCAAGGAQGSALGPAADVPLKVPGTALPRPRGRCPPGLRRDPPPRALQRASAPGSPAAAAVGSFS